MYREARLTRLGEMRDRLVEVFHKRLEGKQLQVITDSKEVDRTKLDATQCYLQMTCVMWSN